VEGGTWKDWKILDGRENVVQVQSGNMDYQV